MADMEKMGSVESLTLADRYADQGRFEEAEAAYRRVLEDDPGNPAAVHRLAVLMLSLGKADEAKRLAVSVLSSGADLATVYNTLGSAEYQLGNTDEAERCFREALRLDNRYADPHYNLGVLDESAGRRDAAEGCYRVAIAHHPDHIGALSRLGALLYRRGSYREALKPLDAAVSADPNAFQANYFRGSVLSVLGRYSEAVDALSVARRLEPARSECVVALAAALRDAGRVEEALTLYQQLLISQPDNLSIHTEINRLAWSAGRSDIFLSSFDHAREVLGEKAPILGVQAAFHLRREEYVKAERLLRRALELDSQNGEFHGLLARAQAGRGKYQESYVSFSSAITLQPDERVHYQEFGFMLLRAGRASEALELFAHAATKWSGDQLLTAGLALAYRQLGDSRYGQLFDYTKYIGVYDLALDEGESGEAGFNQALAQELRTLHSAKAEPIDQTLRGGTQSVGTLLDMESVRLMRLRVAFEGAVKNYLERFATQADSSVPTVRFNGSWSCRLRSGGYHRNHVHPKGRVSSVYYVSLPSSLEDDGRQSGWLKFGESPYALGPLDKPEFLIRPRVGRLVLFPSYIWHGTVPFDQGEERLTIAFDAVPEFASAIRSS